MNERNQEALKASLTGIAAVLTAGLITSFLAPDNSFGRKLEFTLPLLTGVTVGLWIHFRFRDNFMETE
ncbi:MAG: hypothetical protein ABEK10_03355 [Candidatus Nanosalina sp.]